MGNTLCGVCTSKNKYDKSKFDNLELKPIESNNFYYFSEWKIKIYVM
jgi:hypothetical protein